MEMRDTVASPEFQLQQALSLELERRFPQRFIPRYSMVMFHHEISYRTAQQRGAVQLQILADLTRGRRALAEVDYAHAEREINSRLSIL
jgi:kynurenine 3-monooxygenase